MAIELFRRLRGALKSVRPASSDTPRQLFIDDDVVGGIEVLPASRRDWCLHQLGEIERFAARHELPDGSGWSDIYMRPATPAGIADLKIPFSAAVEALGGVLPQIEEVITGSLTTPQIVHRARAFGPSLLTAVVIYHDDSGPNVSWIEVTLRGGEVEVLAVLSAMEALPSPEPLMVVDWERGRIARVGHQDEVGRFVARSRTSS
jgi:hypothetical protein